jgi:cytochrome c peroxidase
MAQVAEKLNADPVYAAKFQGAFGRPATPDNVARALAAYIDSLAPGQAPYDRFLAGDETALTAAQQRGRRLFFNRFHCDACHSGPGFTDERLRPRCYPATNNLSDFRPIAVPPDKMVKTPTLRNLIYTAPYMHTGGLPTLEDVVDFYTPSFEVDTDGEPDLKKPIVHITDAERRDLVEFLKSLSASRPYEERVRE